MSGDSPAPPDYGPMAEASVESSKIMAALGQDQLDFAKQQYEDSLPLYQQITDSQIATQNQTNAQAKDYYDYQQNTFRPVEQGLVDDANKFDTAAYQESQASKAASDMGTAFSNMQAQSGRAMASMGVNPNSGRAMAMAKESELGLAANRAGEMTNARTQADSVGYAKRMDAAGLGRNLTGASQGAYGLALQAGNSAGANNAAAGNQYMQGMAQGSATIGQGRNMLQSGLGSVLNAQGGVYANAPADQTGAIIGGIAGVAGAVMMSDRRLKTNIVQIGVRGDGLTVYAYEYVFGGGLQIGVMADEVSLVYPDAVLMTPSGYHAVDYARI